MYPTLALTLTCRFSARSAILTDAALILIGSLLVAALAQLSISLQPVPFTGQTFAVLIVGAALGSKRGAASLITYIAQGLAGLPVFAGGRSGLAVLLGPTGGYLVGFVVAAFVVGLLAEHGLDRNWKTAIAPFLFGTLAIYLFGVSWLSVFVGINKALVAGLYPFLIGDAIKLILSAVSLPSAWAIVKGLELS